MNKPYKILYLSAIFSGALFLQACGDKTETPAIETVDESSAAAMLAALSSDADPESTTFQTLDGQGFDIDLFAGKKVFVNFWATWCAPCIREIPSINRMAQALEPDGYVFLFASDESTDTIRDFLAEREFQGNFIKLNGYFANIGIGAVPSSWLLDENGEVLNTWAGAYEWDSPEMLEQISN